MHLRHVSLYFSGPTLYSRPLLPSESEAAPALLCKRSGGERGGRGEWGLTTSPYRSITVQFVDFAQNPAIITRAVTAGPGLSPRPRVVHPSHNSTRFRPPAGPPPAKEVWPPRVPLDRLRLEAVPPLYAYWRME
jgi:hypothetical protein